MKPRQPHIENPQIDLFRVELSKIIDLKHPLVKLARRANWKRLDKIFGSTYCTDRGRPGVSTRMMVALHYLKYTHKLSDQRVIDGWIENPYWQYLSGMKWFEHGPPINRSSMTRWRKRLREASLEELLKTLIQAGLNLKEVKADNFVKSRST